MSESKAFYMRKERGMSEIFHHKAHTGGPLPNICPECDLTLAWKERDALQAKVKRLEKALRAIITHQELAVNGYMTPTLSTTWNIASKALSDEEKR